MYPRVFLIALLITAPLASAAEDSQSLFAYDATRPLQVKVLSTTSRSSAIVEDITYASPKGGAVPAFLVTPRMHTRGPALLFSHWGLGNRYAFLDEAITLASSGVTSLLIDAQFVRPGGIDKPAHEVDDVVQTVIDMRRGLDLLRSRADVDPDRVGFAGLSYGARIGAILAGVEPRLRAFVLMGGLASNADEIRNAARPDDVSVAAWQKFIESLARVDAVNWINRPRTAPVFLQFARNDEYISREQAERFDRMATQPEIMKWYEGSHEFNAQSRRDRMSWLATELGFTINDDTYRPVAMPEAPPAAFGAYAEVAKLGVVFEIPGMQHVTVKRDIVYKRDGNTELRMDVYYPLGVEPGLRLPAIIALNGQANAAFMKSMRAMRFSTTFAQALAARANRVVIMPDLRPAATGREPRQRNAALQRVAADVDDLVKYVRDHAAELQIDGESLGILTRSAGYSYGMRTGLLNAPPYIKAVASWYPLLSTEPMRDSGISDEFLKEITPSALIAQPRPLAPLLIVTAQHDSWYDQDTIAAFLAAAEAAHATVQHIHLPDGDHGFEIIDDLEQSRSAFLQTVQFLREHLPVRE